MSERPDRAPTHPDLALCIDELLRRPGAMARVRRLVEQYLDGTEKYAFRPLKDCFSFDEDFDELRWWALAPVDKSTSICAGLPCLITHELQECLEDVPLTRLRPEQTAAAVAAHHEVFCTGVERVVVPDPMRTTVGPTAPPDERGCRRLMRAVAWAATVQTVRQECEGSAGEEVLRWFKLQVREFEQIVANATPAPGPARPGRKQKFDPAVDESLARDWERAKGAGVVFKTFCEEGGVSVKEGDRILARVRNRNKPAGKRTN